MGTLGIGILTLKVVFFVNYIMFVHHELLNKKTINQHPDSVSKLHFCEIFTLTT